MLTPIECREFPTLDGAPGRSALAEQHRAREAEGQAQGASRWKRCPLVDGSLRAAPVEFPRGTSLERGRGAMCSDPVVVVVPRPSAGPRSRLLLREVNASGQPVSGAGTSFCHLHRHCDGEEAPFCTGTPPAALTDKTPVSSAQAESADRNIRRHPWPTRRRNRFGQH